VEKPPVEVQYLKEINKNVGIVLAMKSVPWQPVTCPIAAWDPWVQPPPLRMRLITGATTGKTTTFEDITFRMIFLIFFHYYLLYKS
jgi:hypothetical protein